MRFGCSSLPGRRSTCSSRAPAGNPYELAHALAGEARCLRGLGPGDEADLRATEAGGILAQLGVREQLPGLLRVPAG